MNINSLTKGSNKNGRQRQQPNLRQKFLRRPRSATSTRLSTPTEDTIQLSIQLEDNQVIEITSSRSAELDDNGVIENNSNRNNNEPKNNNMDNTANNATQGAKTPAGNGTEVSTYDTSTLTDEELAKKAQEELNMEGEMEEVSSRECCRRVLPVYVCVTLTCDYLLHMKMTVFFFL
jgi:hypothetical protein